MARDRRTPAEGWYAWHDHVKNSLALRGGLTVVRGGSDALFVRPDGCIAHIVERGGRDKGVVDMNVPVTVDFSFNERNLVGFETTRENLIPRLVSWGLSGSRDFLYDRDVIYTHPACSPMTALCTVPPEVVYRRDGAVAVISYITRTADRAELTMWKSPRSYQRRVPWRTSISFQSPHEVFVIGAPESVAACTRWLTYWLDGEER